MTGIAFSYLLFHREKILENIILVTLSVFLTWMWVMVNQVRLDILEQGIRRGEDAGIDIEMNLTPSIVILND